MRTLVDLSRPADGPPRPVHFWGERALVALAAMHRAIEDGDDRAAAYYATQARQRAIYAGTAARVLEGVR